jgi:transcriptional regulator with XRE-family HTH domain
MIAVPKRPRSQPTPYRALGRRIAQLREDRRLSQREMAKLAHISEGYPSSIESGRTRPDPQILQRLAEVLQVSYGELAVLAGYAPRPQTQDKAARLAQLARFPLWVLDELDAIGAAIFLRRTEAELRQQTRAEEANAKGEQDTEPDEPDAPALLH